MIDNPQNINTRFYPLPCMFTLASLFCGFYSIVSAINSDFKTSAIAILVAAVFDTIDGRVARMTNSTSQFGAELDSLCDMVSFGVSPAVLAYLWALHPYGRYGWLAAFLYVAMTSLRLARFNSLDSQAESKKLCRTSLPCSCCHDICGSPFLQFSWYYWRGKAYLSAPAGVHPVLPDGINPLILQFQRNATFQG